MKNNSNKCMIVIHRNLNLTDVKVKPIPNKERYEQLIIRLSKIFLKIL